MQKQSDSINPATDLAELPIAPTAVHSDLPIADPTDGAVRREKPASPAGKTAPRRPSVGRWPVWVVLASLLWIMLTQREPLKLALAALLNGDVLWMIPAVLLQVLYYWLYAVLYWSAFRAVGVASRPRDLVPILLGSIAVGVAAPGGAAVGAALFVDDAVRRGQSGARAATGALLVVIVELLGVAIISVLGLSVLLQNAHAARTAIACTGILVVVTVLLIAVIATALVAPQLIRTVTEWIECSVGRIAAAMKRPSVLSKGWAVKTAADFIDAADALRSNPWQVAFTLLLSLAMFGVMLASLALMFPAYHHALHTLGDWSTLIAGFVVGMLLWIVSPTPQGIGVVEGGMALTFIAAHLDHHASWSIALAFRAFAFWIPMLCGVFCLRALGRDKRRRGKTHSNNVQLSALLIGIMGVVNVVSAVHPTLRYRFHILHHELALPLDISHGSRLTAALAGFFLLLVARGLLRRKRAAWVLAIVALFISAIAHLVKGLDYEEASLATIIMIWLVTQQAKFYAASDPPSIWQGVRGLAAAVVFTLAYGVTGLWVLNHEFKVNYGLMTAISQTIGMFTTLGPDLVPRTHFGTYFRDSIYAVGASTMTFAVLMFLRPVLYRGKATADERMRAADIVASHGQSPLANYALFDDKDYFFTPCGSVVAYSVIGRTVVALGDPIGPAVDASNAISSFAEYCRRNDWRMGFYQCRPDYLDDYAAAGFEQLCIGHDAVVTLRDFTVLGGSNKQIRWSLNRLTKLGYRVQVLNAPHSEGLISQLREVSDEWLSAMGGSEKRFSLGWFDEAYLQTCRIMVVLDPDLKVTAFANILPRYGQNETSIDLMRRRADVESGTMEFLFVKLLEWAREEGFERFNLGLSPLSGVGDAPDDPAVERALNYIYHHMNQFYSFKGLHTFKSKFRPVWEPRYLIYPNATHLPQIALAVIHANSGGAYLKALATSAFATFEARREAKKPLGKTPAPDDAT
ncbi:MAG TPA: flippase-like domain-containing protein [Capsulimonadaceae bacterium]|jgi:phosphatidylglycerol lysyltransferase